MNACPRCGDQIEPGTYHDPIPSRIVRGRKCAIVAIPRKSVVHYIDDDWNPICGSGHNGIDMMWAFDDEKITCPDCLRLLHPIEASS